MDRTWSNYVGDENIRRYAFNSTYTLEILHCKLLQLDEFRKAKGSEEMDSICALHAGWAVCPAFWFRARKLLVLDGLRKIEK